MREAFQLKKANNIDILTVRNLLKEYWSEIEVNYRTSDLKKITLSNLESTLSFFSQFT